MNVWQALWWGSRRELSAALRHQLAAVELGGAGKRGQRRGGEWLAHVARELYVGWTDYHEAVGFQLQALNAGVVS